MIFFHLYHGQIYQIAAKTIYHPGINPSDEDTFKVLKVL
jgi:hypothetical protein